MTTPPPPSPPPSPQPTLRGGCECGAVRYEVTASPYHRTLCHCAICRRTSGAPAVAWFSVPSDAFSFVRGGARTFRSSPVATRSFCGNCGTPLTFRMDGLGEVDITTCSLDDPEAVPPDDQTFTRSRLAWTETAHRLPGHSTVRNE